MPSRAVTCTVGIRSTYGTYGTYGSTRSSTRTRGTKITGRRDDGGNMLRSGHRGDHGWLSESDSDESALAGWIAPRQGLPGPEPSS